MQCKRLVFVMLLMSWAPACAAAPQWVKSGSAVTTEGVYGVGSASGIDNPQLARTTAENRARLELVRLLQNQHDGRPALVAATLRRSVISDVWYAGETVYARAELKDP